MNTKRLGAAYRLAALACALASPAAASDAVPRILVLSAYPAEMVRLLADTRVTGTKAIDGKTFHLGVLEGHPVVLGLTGIGLVNAAATAGAAVADESFQVGRVVFSGVAGSSEFIGDVTVPTSWTDGRDTWAVDAEMLQIAREVAADPSLGLERCVPAPDPACLGDGATTGTPTPLCVVPEHRPRVVVGGAGRSTDPFGDRALPCVPHGGNVFGCEVCGSSDGRSSDAPRFAEGSLAFMDPALFQRFFEWGARPPGPYVTDDMETAVVARVAGARTAPLPFIAFRGVSDGQGDPLSLPGFPVQFFTYHELAARNAAAVTTAFLRRLPQL
jgi:nucleoside phosphorylase